MNAKKCSKIMDITVFALVLITILIWVVESAFYKDPGNALLIPFTVILWMLVVTQFTTIFCSIYLLCKIRNTLK